MFPWLLLALHSFWNVLGWRGPSLHFRFAFSASCFQLLALFLIILSGIWSSHHLLSLLYAAELALMLLAQDATTWTETAEQVSDQFASQYHCQDFFWPLRVFPEPENRRLATFSQLRTFALGCLATFLACIEATPQLRQTWNTEQAVSMQAKLEGLQDTA